MKITRSTVRGARIEMLPLIDIVFLLLVVFIYAMLSMAVHRGLPVNLPVSSAVTLEKDLILSVTVRSEDKERVYVDEQPVLIKELSGLLRTRAAAMRKLSNAEPGVLLFADRSTDYQKLFSVLDQINRAGLTRISLQADAEHK